MLEDVLFDLSWTDLAKGSQPQNNIEKQSGGNHAKNELVIPTKLTGDLLKWWYSPNHSF